jgi:hypothetical protein
MCTCEDGWSGNDCSLKWCKGGCGGTKGNCNPTGLAGGLPVCECKPEWGGASCKVPCKTFCSNHGQCNHDDRGLPTCTCERGFTGKKCEYECPDQCTGNGACSMKSPYDDTIETAIKMKYYLGKNEKNEILDTNQIKKLADPLSITNSGKSPLVTKQEISILKSKLKEKQNSNSQTSILASKQVDASKLSTTTQIKPKLFSSFISMNEQVKRGTAVATCTCDAGYTGEKCNIKVCPNVCSGHGTCQSDGVCDCEPGFGGEACDINFYNCPKNCNGNGVCTESGKELSSNVSEKSVKQYSCVCKKGFTGDACDQALCDPLCLHGGECKHNVCMCPSGWSGKQCQTKTCPYNCFNHGTCNDDGKCQCEVGYKGESCHIRHVTHGKCNELTQTCKCDPIKDTMSDFPGQMWIGIQCNKKSCPTKDASTICSGHGHCQDEGDNEGQCNCQQGWRNADCSIKSCPNECSGYGTCNTNDGICTCDDKHSGLDCSREICPKKCSGHGTCNFNSRTAKGPVLTGSQHNDQRSMPTSPSCECDTPFFGEACDQLECADDCNNNGKCEHDGNGGAVCMCNDFWTGKKCDITCPVDKITKEQCGGHGECFAERGKAECICSPAYSGLSCSAMCKDGCMGRGNCALNSAGEPTCECEKGYSGDMCQFTTCLNDCSGNGSCNQDGKCTCDRTHTGKDCSQETCPDDCNGHGECSIDKSGKLKCDCNMGWLGDSCFEEVRCENDCSGHGDCLISQDNNNTLVPTCSCNGEWHGAICEKKRCLRGVNTLECSGHGICGDAGECTCNSMFEGAACEEHDCTMTSGLGLEGGVSTECSGHGTCQSGACVCDQGFTDSSCSIKACPMFMNKLCGDHGICDPDGTCSCLNGWSGEACHIGSDPIKQEKRNATKPTEEVEKTAAVKISEKNSHRTAQKKVSSIDLENLNEAKEELVDDIKNKADKLTIKNDVKVMVQDAAIVGQSTQVPEDKSNSNSMRFREEIKSLSDPKMDATNVEIERDTEIIERVAKTNPENIETLASDLALKAEKLTDEKTKEIVQEENEKKDNEPITEDTLKKKVEDAQEKYDFAEAEGNVNDIGELKNDLNAKKELLNVLIAPSSVEGESSSTNTTNITISVESRCPNGCNGNGKCDNNGLCICNPSFTGEDCSFKLCASCKHGMCHENKCICQTNKKTNLPMFFGSKCALRECPNVIMKEELIVNGTRTIRIPCGGHGKCLSTGDALNDAACDCDDGYSGIGCSIELERPNKEGKTKHATNIVACNRKCTATCDERSKGEPELYFNCFQSCSQKCTGFAPVLKKSEASQSTPTKLEKRDIVLDSKKYAAIAVPEAVETNADSKRDSTKDIHTIISKAQHMTLGDINVPEKGRNSNDTTHNADEAIDLERQHPVDTEPTPKETCERCKMKLEKEAGEMDVQNLGKFLKNVCEREGGNQNECIKIENDYYANQLHDGKNLNLALGRFCNTFFEVPCKDDEENGGKVVRRRLRRRRR